MGCTSSVTAKVEEQETSKNNFQIPTISKDEDTTSDYSSIGALGNTLSNEDFRRLSVLTVRNGNISCRAVTKTGTPQTVLRDVDTGLPVHTPHLSLSSHDSTQSTPTAKTRRPRQQAQKKSPVKAVKIRPMKQSSLAPPNPNHHYITRSTPTSPYMTKGKRRASQNGGRSSTLELRNSLNDSQRLLNKALRELSESLSESHGNIFSLGRDEDAAFPSSRASVSPATSRVSTQSLLNEADSEIILDVGSGYCKAGFSHEDVPSVVFPTIVGRPISEDVLPGVALDEKFIGNEAKLRKDALTFSAPVRRGIVQNWDEWMGVVDHVLNMEMKIERDDFGIVLPQPTTTNRESLEKIAEMIFEIPKVNRIFLARSAPMALHAFGMTSGLLVSIGHDVSSCVPVLQGNVLEEGIRELNIGGSDITQTLKMLMKEQKPTLSSFRNFFHDDITKAMMERLCYVMVNENRDSRTSPRPRTYSLPTGGTVNLGRERFLAPEILFKPGLFGDTSNAKGLQEICCESIEALRTNKGEEEAKSLCQNVVLVGGTSLLPGIPERLKSELVHLLPWLSENEITVQAPQRRQYAVWRGAAQMASLNSTKSRWTTRQDFEKYGPSVVHRKYL
uniref:actin-like n=1 Tax=Ciona intestinalis TaxID=7719 RepID=UPI000180BC15|nr:actin-like [Ciona intestinalis]|eukprot:XP_018666660.1 actin-like [Ciona intestinalis]